MAKCMEQVFTNNLVEIMTSKGMTFAEVASVFAVVDGYLFARRESQRPGEDDDYRRFYAETLPRYREWADDALAKYDLGVTIETIELMGI